MKAAFDRLEEIGVIRREFRNIETNSGMVLNNVMYNRKFPFEDSPDTACITCYHVLEGYKPILYVSHDEDGYWQFLCGENHKEEDARVVSLGEILSIDESMRDLAVLDYGQYATSESVEGNWTVKYKN